MNKETVYYGPLFSNDEEFSSSDDSDIHVYPLIEHETSINSTKKKWDQLGLILALISGFFYAVSSFVIKEITWATAGELTLVRYTSAVIFSLPIYILAGRTSASLSDGQYQYDQRLGFLCAVRGLVASIAIFFRYCSFKRLPLANANLITFSSPPLVSLFACTFLKERCSLTLTSSLILSIVGLVLVVTFLEDNTSSSNIDTSSQTLGVMYGFISLLFDTSTYLMGRYMKIYHPASVQFHASWSALISTITINLVMDIYLGADLRHSSEFHSNCYIEGGLMLSLGVSSFLASAVVLRAFQLEEAGPVSVIRTSSEIAIIFALQVTLKGQKPGITVIIGSILVISAGAILNLRKTCEKKFVRNQ